MNNCSIFSRLAQAAFILSLLLGDKTYHLFAQDNAPSPSKGGAGMGKNTPSKAGQPSVQDIMGKVGRSFEKSVYNSALAGKIIPFFSHFSLSSVNAKNILPELKKQVDIEDVFIIAALGWLTVPAARLPYSSLVKQDVPNEFENTYLYQFSTLLSQAAKLALLVYGIDCIGIILKTIGFRISPNMSGTATKIVYSTWFARRIQIFKHYLINKALSRNAEKTGQAIALNQILNGFVFVCLALFVLDVLSVEMGLALTSVVAVGSTATLIFSLGSKDIAAKVMNGLALALSDKMYEGDYVEFGDGLSGTILKMGWLEANIRCSNELTVSIPNTMLANQLIYNVSRCRKSQVTQSLRFRYEDVDKLPRVLEDIKAEVRLTCPGVITDGSRAFRAHWRDFRDDYLEVVVDFHFDIKPSCEAYWNNKQRVLMAISRAVKKNGVAFYTTTGTFLTISEDSQ